jgi:hypothetical protein
MISPAEWSGMWRDGSEFGINLTENSGLEITPDNHLRTDSWLIPHNDGSVGDKLEEMQMKLRGIDFIDLLTCGNIVWTDNTIIGDAMPNNDEQFVEDVLSGDVLDCNIHIEGEGFGRGFSVWTERQDDTFIGVFNPEDWGDEWEFERFELDTVNHKARLICKPDTCWFIGQPIHKFDLQVVETNRPVKFVDGADGIWINRMNGGERVEIGIDEQYIYGLVNNRLSSIGVAEEGEF